MPVLVATAALGALLAVRSLATSRAIAIWIVLVAGLALLVLIRHARGRDRPQHTGRFEDALRAREVADTAPTDLRRVEGLLELGVSFAGDAHYRLLPLLRAVAAARLSSRHGVEIDRRPEAARAVLGEDAWELLRPDRPAPEDRFARGIPRDRVAALVERVDSL